MIKMCRQHLCRSHRRASLVCLQGDCRSPPLANVTRQLIDYTTPRCLLATVTRLLFRDSDDERSELWLSNLHIRSVRQDAVDATRPYGLVAFQGNRQDVYVSNCTFEGDGGPVYGLSAANGTRLYVEGAQAALHAYIAPRNGEASSMALRAHCARHHTCSVASHHATPPLCQQPATA